MIHNSGYGVTFPSTELLVPGVARTARTSNTGRKPLLKYRVRLAALVAGRYQKLKVNVLVLVVDRPAILSWYR